MTKINGVEIVQTSDATLHAPGRRLTRNHAVFRAACNDFFARRGINTFEQLTSFFPHRKRGKSGSFKFRKKKK